MKVKSLSLAAISFAALLCAGSLYGAGFALYETSGAGVGLGGAIIGHAEGASTLYHNASLMTDLPGDHLEFGISMINPSMEIQVDQGEGFVPYSPADQWFPPPFAYYTHQFSERWWGGFSFFTPYGLGVRNDETWPGRYNSVESEINVFTFGPTAAYKFSDEFSLAAAFEFTMMDITLTRWLAPTDSLLEMSAFALNVAGSFSASYRLPFDLTLGIVYRMPCRLELTGDTYLGGKKVPSECSENMTLPQSFSVGANYAGLDRFNFGAIATWTDWTSYKSLGIDFDPPLLGAITGASATKQWRAVWRYGLGAEYKLSELSFLQFGYVYDVDPVSPAHADYILPAGDRHIISFGLRVKLSETWTMNAAYAKIRMHDCQFTGRPNEGFYDTRYTHGDANIITISLLTNF